MSQGNMSPFSSTNVSAKSSIPSNRQTFFIDSPKGNQSKRNDEGKQYKFFSPIPMRKRYAFSADKAGSIASNDVATSSVAGDTECELTESMEAPSKQSKQKKEKKDFNDFDIWRPSRASLKRAAMQDNSGEPFKSKASSMPFPSNTLEEHSGGTASTILSCDFTAKIMEARRRMQAMAASDMGRKIFQSDEKQPEQRTSKGKSKQSGMSQNYKRVATNDSASKVKKNIDDEKTVRVVKEPHCGYELDAYATAKEVSIRNNMRWSSSRFQRNAPGCVSNMERANAIRTELISMGINDLAKSNAAKDEPRSKVTSGSNISMTLSQAKLARNELIKMGYSEHDCLSKSFKQFIWTSGPSTKRKLYVPARKYYLSGSGDRAEENCDGRLYEQPPKPRELERVKNAGAFVEDKVPKKLPYMLSDTYNEYIKFQEPTMPPVLRAESVSNRSSSNDWERSKNMNQRYDEVDKNKTFGAPPALNTTYDLQASIIKPSDGTVTLASSTFSTTFKKLEFSILNENINVQSILKEIDMERYIEKFSTADIGLFEFVMLDEADLTDLGVAECDKSKFMEAVEKYADSFEVDISFSK